MRGISDIIYQNNKRKKREEKERKRPILLNGIIIFLRIFSNFFQKIII